MDRTMRSNAEFEFLKNITSIQSPLFSEAKPDLKILIAFSLSLTMRKIVVPSF